LQYVARILGYAVLVAVVPFVGGVVAGKPGAISGVALGVLFVLWLWLWLPRLAHRAFVAGKFERAMRRYRLLGLLSTSRTRTRASLLSRSGCYVALGDAAIADVVLVQIDPEGLSPAEHAVWLNNRACARLAANEGAEALKLADEASALRPDVPALQHTRGIALLALGRVDDAIAVFDGMRAGGELPAFLEAERCRDLAKAWSQKGETAYAEDYERRAAQLVQPAAR
jgi:predicted Zn-dependent protease